LAGVVKVQNNDVSGAGGAEPRDLRGCVGRCLSNIRLRLCGRYLTGASLCNCGEQVVVADRDAIDCTGIQDRRLGELLTDLRRQRKRGRERWRWRQATHERSAWVSPSWAKRAPD